MNGALPARTGYQVWLTALLSLNFGLVLFDRNALNFLMPFVQPELGLSNTEVGALSGGLSLTWALAALAIGAAADRFGSRQRLLVICTLVFALCSFGSGVAAGFVAMLATRLLMGVAEGGIMPLSQALIVAQVEPRRRGLAMGIAQGLGSSLMGSFIAPVVLVGFATAHGWRPAFFLAGAPALLSALLLALSIRDVPAGQVAAPAHAGSDGRATNRSPAARPPAERPRGAWYAVLADGNVRRCAVLSIVFVAYLVVTWAFMPLYLVRTRHYDAATMSWLMGVLGIAATLFSFLVTGLSDRIGRRPVMLVAPLLALILPLGALYYPGSPWGLAVLFFVGWTFTGIMPLFMATVPAESVAPQLVGTAMGLCMGGSEILGGVLAPLASGYAADRYGLQAPVWTLVLLALAGSVVALGIRETAPRRTRRPAG